MRSLLLGVALLAVGGCSGGAESGGQGGPTSTVGAAPKVPPTGPVVATVGDGFVSADDFATAAGRSPSAAEGELDLEVRKEILDKLVTEEILFQEAAARGLYRDPKVRKIMVSLLVREQVYDQVRASDFTPEELRAFYEAHKAEFTVPEKAQVRRIFVSFGETRTRDEAQALIDDLRRKILRDPSAFGDLAEQHSEDPYKRRGGDLGFITAEGKPGVPPEVVEKAFELTPGRLSDVFEAGGGFNIVLTVAKREAVERTFEQMKGSVLRRMKNDRFQVLTNEYIDEIREKYPVSVDESALTAVDVEARPMPHGPDPSELFDEEIGTPGHRRPDGPGGRRVPGGEHVRMPDIDPDMDE